MACQHDPADTPTPEDELLRWVEEASPTGDISHFILPEEDDYASIPQDVKNPLSAAKVELGKFLFHETGIGTKAVNSVGLKTFSCASCHIADKGFRPGRVQGIADGGLGFGIAGEGRELNGGYAEFQIDAQGIRPLSVLNAAFVSNTLWNGQFGGGGVNEGLEDVWRQFEDTKINDLGFEAIESQSFEGMKLHRMEVDEDLIAELNYTAYFDAAFPDLPDTLKYSNYAASLALSAYIRGLVTSEAGFQSYLKGDESAMSYDEIAGAKLFFGKAGCARCHSGSNLGDATFHGIGVKDMYEHEDALFTSVDDKKNLGRGGFTGEESDMFNFRVPQLYNLKGNSHFFHGASLTTVRDVVSYFNDGIPENSRVPIENISPLFEPLDLTELEIDKITKFLELSLYDHNLDRYLPIELPSGNCFPNADFVSVLDLGCQ